MTGYLLDTNIVLIAPEDPSALSREIQNAVLEGPNYVSVVSYWEVMIKSMKGSVVVGDPAIWWRDMLEELAATQLPLMPQHIVPISGLPAIHKDPFDRVLIAQAISQGLTLVTTDIEVSRYASRNLPIII